MSNSEPYSDCCVLNKGEDLITLFDNGMPCVEEEQEVAKPGRLQKTCQCSERALVQCEWLT